MKTVLLDFSEQYGEMVRADWFGISQVGGTTIPIRSALSSAEAGNESTVFFRNKNVRDGHKRLLSGTNSLLRSLDILNGKLST
jgi:hypothetical protein